jgi:hypothetical protein
MHHRPKEIDMSTITPAEFAEIIGSDGRTVRKFLRNVTPKDEHPGKGARWALPGTKREVTKLQKQFTEWAAAQEKARTEREEKAAQVDEVEVEETEEEPTVEDLEVEVDEELDD